MKLSPFLGHLLTRLHVKTRRRSRPLEAIQSKGRPAATGFIKQRQSIPNKKNAMPLYFRQLLRRNSKKDELGQPKRQVRKQSQQRTKSVQTKRPRKFVKKSEFEHPESISKEKQTSSCQTDLQPILTGAKVKVSQKDQHTQNSPRDFQFVSSQKDPRTRQIVTQFEQREEVEKSAQTQQTEAETEAETDPRDRKCFETEQRSRSERKGGKPRSVRKPGQGKQQPKVVRKKTQSGVVSKKRFLKNQPSTERSVQTQSRRNGSK